MFIISEQILADLADTSLPALDAVLAAVLRGCGPCLAAVAAPSGRWAAARARRGPTFTPSMASCPHSRPPLQTQTVCDRKNETRGHPQAGAGGSAVAALAVQGGRGLCRHRGSGLLAAVVGKRRAPRGTPRQSDRYVFSDLVKCVYKCWKKQSNDSLKCGRCAGFSTPPPSPRSTRTSSGASARCRLRPGASCTWFRRATVEPSWSPLALFKKM